MIRSLFLTASILACLVAPIAAQPVLTGPETIPCSDDPAEVIVTDVDNDGIADLAVLISNADTELQVFSGLGGGAFSAVPSATVLPMTATWTMRSADFDADGNVDFVFSDALASSLVIALGDGALNFDLVVRSTFAFAFGLGVGDIDGDGLPDVVTGSVGSDSFSVVYSEGAGDFAFIIPSFPTSDGIGSLDVEDMDGDGDNDVIVGHPDSVEVLFNDGAGSFPTSVLLTGPSGAAVYGLEVADITGDGVLDILATSSSDFGVSVFVGLGSGDYAAAIEIPTGANPHSVDTADFDADGIVDLACVNQDDSTVWVYQGDGAGNFTQQLTLSILPGAWTVTAADYDEDSRVDLIVNSLNAETISMFHNEGPLVLGFRRGDANADTSFDISDAIFTLSNLFASGPGPSCDDSADVNDDGALDISDAIFTLAALFSAGSTPPPPPGALDCGPDPTADTLECASYGPCG